MRMMVDQPLCERLVDCAVCVNFASLVDTTAMAELTVGATFADHEIRGVAGRGGMGVVYRALDLRLKREVALKVIAPASSKDPEFRTRFRRECETAASIHHPNLIPIYTAGVNPRMLETAGRVADGVLGHTLFTRRYVEEVVRPAVARGAWRS